YWTERLAGARALQSLPGDRPRPAVQSYRGAVHRFRLSGALGGRVKELARSQSATLFTTLFAAFNLVLLRFGGREDWVVGTPVANRGWSELEALIGFFVSMLPLRTRVDPAAGFGSLLRTVHEGFFAAYDHQGLPFETLVEELAPDRDPSTNPLFQIAFALQTVSPDLALAPGLELRRTEVDWEVSHFDLTLHLWDRDGELEGRLAYSTDLYDEATVVRLARGFEVLLEGLTAEPERAVGELPLLHEAEARQVVREWNRDADGAAAKLLGNLPTGLKARTEPRLYLVDGGFRPVPYGAVGEVLVGGLSAVGELREDVAEELSPDPFDPRPEARLLRTGERARWRPGGVLERLGGGMDRIWIDGVLVHPARIERALSEEPGVVDCAVSARETSGGRELVAYVVVDGTWSPEILRKGLAERLPSQAVPGSYVRVSALPLTETGEVDVDSLAPLEAIDPERIDRWEEALRHLSGAGPGADEVALVVREERPPERRLHLADLLPGWRRTSGPAVAEPVAPEEPAQVGEGRPSIVDGTAVEWGADAPRTLPEALARAAEQASRRGVVHLEEGGEETRQTYADLLEEVRRIAGGLRALGLGPGDRLILQLDRSRDFIPVFWGAILGGIVPVPISVPPTDEPDSAGARKLGNAWELLGRPWIAAGESVADRVRGLSRDGAFQVATAGELARGTPVSRPHRADPEDLALLLLTSGSTGRAKAVQQSHLALLSRAAASARLDGFGEDDVSLNWMPLDHVGGIVMFHLRDVWTCCEQIQAPIEPVLRRPLLWLDWIERYRATISWAPNFAYGLVADQPELASRSWDLSSMRFLLNGGEAIVARTARRFLTLLAPHGLPPTAMRPAWGMSETCSGVTSSHRFLLESTSDDDAFVEVGGPIPGVSLRIVDEADAPVPEGATGRLQVRGAPVTSGYFGRPELDAEVFTDDGWFQTGDLGVLREGRLTITGREKDVIIVNGINYYSHEIEAVVEEVEGVEVSFTAACGVRVGGDTDHLAVFFTPRVSGAEPLRELLQEIRSRVVRKAGLTPEYLVPLSAEEVPKTAIGKIQRPQLKERFEAGELEPALRRVDLLLETSQTLPDWFFRKVWRRERLRGPVTDPPPARHLILGEGEGLGERLRDLLAEDGCDCRMVHAADECAWDGGDRYRIDPSRGSHLGWLAESLVEQGFWPDRVVVLWSYGEPREPAGVAELEASHDRGVLGILSLVQALAAARSGEETLRLLVVTTGAQAVATGDAVAAARATLGGWLKTVPAELSWVRCRHIDLEADEIAADARRVHRESMQGGFSAEVAYRGSTRWVPRLERIRPRRRPGRELPFLPGGFYLISGGLGGIGREVAAFLLEHYDARLLLVGRTDLGAETAEAAERARLFGELGRL
ncbi:MAG: AMP-binding protein, partial [Acidobacteriota bacterium]